MDIKSLKKSVWQKGKIVDGFDPNIYRQDPCGAWIVWDKYGVSDSMYGWEIDHIYPKSKLISNGFSEDEINDLRNLRPMQHSNNASKGDDYPSYTCVVTSDGNKNVDHDDTMIVNEATRIILGNLYGV